MEPQGRVRRLFDRYPIRMLAASTVLLATPPALVRFAFPAAPDWVTGVLAFPASIAAGCLVVLSIGAALEASERYRQAKEHGDLVLRWLAGVICCGFLAIVVEGWWRAGAIAILAFEQIAIVREAFRRAQNQSALDSRSDPPSGAQ